MSRTPRKIKQTWSLALIFILFLSAASCNDPEETPATDTTIMTPSVPIQEAAFFGNVNAIKQHIASGSNLDEKDDYGSTPLTIAATFGKTQVAILLINAGADLEATSADGSSPLHTAAFLGRTEIVAALLDKDVDITLRNGSGATALESVSAPFSAVKPIYDQLNRDLGPLGFKLDYEQLEAERPSIAKMIQAHVK